MNWNQSTTSRGLVCVRIRVRSRSQSVVWVTVTPFLLEEEARDVFGYLSGAPSTDCLHWRRFQCPLQPML